LSDKSGYALGLVAAHDKRGIAVGYLFHQRREGVPPLESLRSLTAAEATRVKRFGDLGLVRGAWPVIGRFDDWASEDWPMPAFGWRETWTGRAFRLIYDPDDPADLVAREPISVEECERLPEDSLYDYVALERVMTRLQDPGWVEPTRDLLLDDREAFDRIMGKKPQSESASGEALS
jgi:hypothetical protein